MLKFNFIALTLCLITLSCKKDEVSASDPVVYEEIEPNLKALYTFQTGDYWVYEDNFGNLDTVIVDSVSAGYTETTPMGGKTRFEFISLHLQSNIQGQLYNHYLISNHIKHNGGGFWGEGGQPIFVSNAEVGHEFNGILTVENIDSLNLFGEEFYNIVKTTLTASEQFENWFDYNRHFYFCPNKGLIKYVIEDPSGDITWNLKSYLIQ